MRARTSFLVAGWLVPALLAACSSREVGQAKSGGQLRVGDAAPNFTLAAAADGKVSLSGFAGKPVLLYFSMGPG